MFRKQCRSRSADQDQRCFTQCLNMIQIQTEILAHVAAHWITLGKSVVHEKVAGKGFKLLPLSGNIVK